MRIPRGPQYWSMTTKSMPMESEQAFVPSGQPKYALSLSSVLLHAWKCFSPILRFLHSIATDSEVFFCAEQGVTGNNVLGRITAVGQLKCIKRILYFCGTQLPSLIITAEAASDGVGPNTA